MAISKTEDLFLLIKSLSKSEKRSFRLYAERIHDHQLEYMKLFDLMDKAKKISDTTFIEALQLTNKTQYSNYKRHLYTQILTSLRMTKKTGFTNFKVRELIDFAYVLYTKGFHMQALKILSKAKALSSKEDLAFSSLTILEIEKMIHSRHITRADSVPIIDILDQSSKIADSINNRVKLSNLRMTMHMHYIKYGHAKNKTDEHTVINIFKNQISGINEESLSKAEKIHLNQAYVWYYYILNEFKNCFNYSEKWVLLFNAEKLSKLDVNLYFRAYHYLLISLFFLREKDQFEIYYSKLAEFRNHNYNKFDENSKILSFLYVHQARLNYYIINRQYNEGIKVLPRTIKRLHKYKVKLDVHKVMIFYFKMAWILLMGGQPEKALKYIHYITNMSNSTLRIDIQIYARLMHLMVQVDLGHHNIIKSLVTQCKRFITNHISLEGPHKWFLEYLTKYTNAPLLDRKDITSKYLNLLENLKKDKYAKRSILYLDITEWLTLKNE